MRNTPKRVVVLGGYGAVGAHTTALLRSAGHTVITTGRDPARADHLLNIRDHAAAAAMARGADIVINATGAEDPGLAMSVTGAGAVLIDITATQSYLEDLARHHHTAPILVSVGVAPGITNLLAAELHRRTPGPIDIVIMLGAGKKHGAAATEWTNRLVGAHFTTPDGTRVRNFSSSRVFRLPNHGRRRAYRADFSDQHVLSRDLGTPVRSYFLLDSRAATGALAILTRLPGPPRMPAGMPVPGATDRFLLLARATSGEAVYVPGREQSRATAAVTAAMVTFAHRLQPGIQHIHHIAELDEVARITGLTVGQQS
ncbi:NAD-dependent epimerase/dehydratase family protein [Hoyosella sp. YIM 151337]|uniref:NAD-dependent epimerase/dehydratase family protein n=1 Tax=Hoyosella sp. YIM 151337 TaxID=2992742 RepID=UPI002235C067|nr:NAD-dependent epimerase/dehydratase family protein [Hoyosella sp. YIM 151337]MCW4351794.1 NAD-dependent epimerase/dehydratase family protein [Hoyosella sp. YIM 151337]